MPSTASEPCLAKAPRLTLPRANFSASQMPRARPSRPPIGPKMRALAMARSPSKSETPAQPMMTLDRKAAATNPTTAPTIPLMMAHTTPIPCPR